jgi:hypothetical protein
VWSRASKNRRQRDPGAAPPSCSSEHVNSVATWLLRPASLSPRRCRAAFVRAQAAGPARAHHGSRPRRGGLGRRGAGIIFKTAPTPCRRHCPPSFKGRGPEPLERSHEASRTAYVAVGSIADR